MTTIINRLGAIGRPPVLTGSFGLWLMATACLAQDNNVRLGPNAGTNITNPAAVNVMIGNAAGVNTTAGNYNTFIGNAAGSSNRTGNYNTCIGDGAGYVLTGDFNMMLGVHAGFQTTVGGSNVMIGLGAGFDNTTGSQNTLIGTGANVGVNNLVNATAIGANALASVSNTLILGNNANVGIGTSTPGSYKLAVEGKIGAREVEVKTGSWADFVFAHNYKLPTLSEVERHITDKLHLPGIPSEADIKQNGYSLEDMDAKLLQKIEELTLYLIEQQKRIECLEQKLSSQTH